MASPGVGASIRKSVPSARRSRPKIRWMAACVASGVAPSCVIDGMSVSTPVGPRPVCTSSMIAADAGVATSRSFGKSSACDAASFAPP